MGVGQRGEQTGTVEGMELSWWLLLMRMKSIVGAVVLKAMYYQALTWGLQHLRCLAGRITGRRRRRRRRKKQSHFTTSQQQRSTDRKRKSCQRIGVNCFPEFPPPTVPSLSFLEDPGKEPFWSESNMFAAFPIRSEGVPCTPTPIPAGFCVRNWNGREKK